jgi:hypothetical protein
MVSQVTIKAKVGLYKADQPANSIELLQFEEVGFEIVRQKNLNQIGDKLLLIYPDFCIPDNELFKEYWYPGGDASKSKLGKQGRVRAVKFNLHRGDGQPVYSNGIVLTPIEVGGYFNSIGLEKNNSPFFTLEEITDEDLGITKYESPEVDSNGRNLKAGSSNPFPSDIYKTDEPNFLTMPDRSMFFPCKYTGRVKYDGSSETIWYKNGKYGICSRNLSKPLTEKYVSGVRKMTWWEKFKYHILLKQVDVRVWSEKPAENDFVKHGKKYLDKLVKFCEENKVNLILRGELSGQGLNGSGNKNNPHSKLPADIRFFGADYYFTKGAERIPESKFQELIKELDIPECEIVFDRVFESKEELVAACEEYFKSNLVEGIVIRNELGFSAKYMCKEYDSKK